MILGEKTGRWRRVLQVVRSMQATTSSLPEFSSIGHKNQKVQWSKRLHCTGWSCPANSLKLWSQQTLNILASVLCFLFFFSTGVPLHFLQPAVDENLYPNSGPNQIVYNAAIGACEKGPIPAFFDGPSPRAFSSSCSLNVGFIGFICSFFLARCQASGGSWTLSSLCDSSRFSQIYRVFCLGNLSCMKSAAGTFCWAEPKKSRASQRGAMTCHVGFRHLCQWFWVASLGMWTLISHWSMMKYVSGKRIDQIHQYRIDLCSWALSPQNTCTSLRCQVFSVFPFLSISLPFDLAVSSL